VDWVAGVLWVLGRARDEGLGYCVRLATAAARWRPRGWPGWRGEGRGDPARGKEGGVESERDAWVPPLSAGGREKQRSREVGDEVWTDLQFPKSLGALL